MKRLSALLLIPLLTVFLLTGCVERNVITAETFISETEARGFRIEYSEYNGEPKYPLTADNGNYQIMFYSCTDENSAESIYTRAVSIIESETDYMYISITLTGDTYNYRSLNSNGKYYVVSRVENTVMICYAAPEEYRDEIIQIMTDLGYDS